MDAPKCKFCGVSEWRHICGGLVKSLPARKDVPRSHVVLEEVPEKVRNSHNEYMRVYMRVWRKKRALKVETALAVMDGRACLLKS